MLRPPKTRRAKIQLTLITLFLIAFAYGAHTLAGYIDRVALYVDLRDAISRGDVEAVKRFEQEGIDWRDLIDYNNNYSPLHIAVRGNRIELVQYLVENGADVFAKNPGGFTAAGQARFYQHVNVLKYLLMDTPHGERIAQEDQSIHPIGPYADLELVAWLAPRIDLKDSIFGEHALRLLCLAVQEDDEAMLEHLLELGAPDAMAPGHWDEGFYQERQNLSQSPPKWLALHQDPSLPSPLHQAARLGNEEFTKRLLQYGANPQAKDIDGKTPIDYAKSAGHETVALLLERARHAD